MTFEFIEISAGVNSSRQFSLRALRLKEPAESYLRAAQHSWHLQRDHCLCRLWRKEDQRLQLALFSPERRMRTHPPGAAQTSSLLRQVGIDIGPQAAAVPSNQTAPPAGCTGLVWRWSGCSPSPTKTHLKDKKCSVSFQHYAADILCDANTSWRVFPPALTIQAAKAVFVAFPLLMEVLGSIKTSLDDIPPTICRETEKVEL